MLLWQLADCVPDTELQTQELAEPIQTNTKISASPPKSLDMQNLSWWNTCSGREEDKLFCTTENITYCKENMYHISKLFKAKDRSANSKAREVYWKEEKFWKCSNGKKNTRFNENSQTG